MCFKKKVCGICNDKMIGTYFTIKDLSTGKPCYYICSFCRNNYDLASGSAAYPLDPQETKRIIENARQDNGLIERKVLCKSCDNVFCYTSKDLARNQLLKEKALISSDMSLFSTIFDSTIAGNQHESQAEQYKSRIVDYNKCPHCGSADLKILDKDAYEEYLSRKKASQPVATNPASSTDELKKYKELLDGGIITQEEFDAKKKQLLGL